MLAKSTPSQGAVGEGGGLGVAYKVALRGLGELLFGGVSQVRVWE